MIEILSFGDITKDFERLGVTLRQTYVGEDYSVCEVTEDEFKTLDNEPDIEGTWQDGGWRYAEGSNQFTPNEKIKINGKEIIAWYDDSNDFDSEEEREEYLEEHDGIMPLEEYQDLLTYLCDEVGCSQPRNVCAVTIDLAKYNNVKLSELFKIYQG